MSTYRLKPCRRRNPNKMPRLELMQSEMLKRKRRLALDLRRRNLARATQHLLSLEKRYPAKAKLFKIARENTVKLADSLTR